MRPELYHYTAAGLSAVHSVPQPTTVDGWPAPPKPCGLWVSVEGDHDWPAWCMDSHFAVESLARRYRIVLRDPAALLWITTSVELLDFTRAYAKRVDLGGGLDWSGHYIDWSRVAAAYAGIVISPYQWSCRMDRRTFWYYGWDCASGCIWDAAAVETVQPDLTYNMRNSGE